MKKQVICGVLILAIVAAMLSGYASPTAEAAAGGATTISAGDGYTLAIKADGSLWTGGK